MTIPGRTSSTAASAARRFRSSTHTTRSCYPKGPGRVAGGGAGNTIWHEEEEVSIRNLDKIFKPQRIAVIGASNNPGSVGYTVLRNLIGAGFDGVVYPVNPRRESIQGIQAYPSVMSLPKAPDLAVICTPASSVPGLGRECGEAG
ncbi:CoA-binding protein, partial [Candidatus Bipolaricaulota bacterium]|nr:CoA-binding protein [Candidatus Bipolaricaulota bacterium]